MTNLNKISDKDENRLQTLFKRRERLIKMNKENHYVRVGHPKIQKYYSCILYVRREINNEECKNISLGKKSTAKAFRGFLNPQNELSIKDLFNLTSPDYAK